MEGKENELSEAEKEAIEYREKMIASRSAFNRLADACSDINVVDAWVKIHGQQVHVKCSNGLNLKTVLVMSQIKARYDILTDTFYKTPAEVKADES
jgi:hypothetical protein